MSDYLLIIFGEGNPLSATQMMCRGAVVFAATLVMIRISGRRSLGLYSPFDSCITVLLGSILARAVVGASPLIPTLATGLTLVLIHRAIAMIAVRSHWFHRWVDGTPKVIIREGTIDHDALRSGLVSMPDLKQALREQLHSDSLSLVRTGILERNGVISFVK